MDLFGTTNKKVNSNGSIVTTSDFLTNVALSNPLDVCKMRAHFSHEVHLHLFDLYRALENTSGISAMHIFAKKCKLEMLHVNREWNNVDRKWECVVSGEQFYMVPYSKLVDIVTELVNRTRKCLRQKMMLCKRLNVEIPENCFKVPIENSVLEVFTAACPFPVELQYRLGKYKLDAFIPRMKIAIQVDESNHSRYNQTEEKEYDTVIRDHDIVCVRFVPDIKDSMASALKLINIIWQRTLSPDFHEFKHRHNLG